MSKVIIEKVKEVILPYLEEENIILYDIEYVFEDNENILRIYIDNEEENMDLLTCVSISEGISKLLDLNDPLDVPYSLEVSSPGLERKFKSDKEFVIFKGRRVSIKLKTPLEGETERIFKGEIVDWDDNEGLTFLRFDDGEELQIPKSNIQSAKLYID